ncbi:APC family permease [Rhodocaloribacter sp.]
MKFGKHTLHHKKSGSNRDSGALGLKELIAMGVGGMIGGGIFSVLGLAVSITGHAAPIAFALGGVVALTAGYSYVKLALAYRDDGASFTYLERAFPRRPNVAGAVGWTVILGYIGTLALYAFTFGAYGAELFDMGGAANVRMLLSASIILFFMLINLMGARASGEAEDLVVYTKIILLTLLAIAGLGAVKKANLVPVFDQGLPSVFMAGALIFVAYEGFQLITNAVTETRNPERNIPRGIYGSVGIVAFIYVTLAVVGVGSLPLDQLVAAEEYALAVAVEPALGNAGRVLVAVAALLATSSAINATMFGAARMMAEMTRSKKMPHAFSFRNRVDVPWVAVVALTAFALALTLLGGLELIASFSSMTFLLVSIGVSIANIRLRAKTHSRIGLILPGFLLMLATVVTLVYYLWHTARPTLLWIFGMYAAVLVMEFVFSKRGLLHKG